MTSCMKCSPITHGGLRADLAKHFPEHYLFPARRPTADPTKPCRSLKKGWGEVRKRAKGKCRLHDLRHTAIPSRPKAKPQTQQSWPWLVIYPPCWRDIADIRDGGGQGKLSKR